MTVRFELQKGIEAQATCDISKRSKSLTDWAQPDPVGWQNVLAGFSESVSDQKLAEALTKGCRVVKASRTRVLFRQDDPPQKLYFVNSGTVILKMKLPNGEVLGFKAEPRHLIGLPAVSGGHPYSMTATACKGAELCEITLEYFRTIIGRDPALSFRVLQILATEVHSARRLLGTMLSSAANSNLPLEDSE